MDLGRSGRRFGRLGARLDGHLGGPRAGLDAILGPLGRPRKHFGGDCGGFGVPKRVQKNNFLDPKWKNAKLQKHRFSSGFVMILEVQGALEIDQMGSSGYQN